MRFKAGDKAKVKTDLVTGKMYGEESFEESMEFLRGHVVTISDVLYGFYQLEEDDEGFYFTEEMLDEVVDECQPDE